MLQLFWLLFWLLLTTVLGWARPRQDLMLENLLLRHQLAVLTRPSVTRPLARLCAWDKLLWVLARRWCAGWRQHLAIVTPVLEVNYLGSGTGIVQAGVRQSAIASAGPLSETEGEGHR